MDVPDLITNEWFLVSSWRLPIFILGLYLWFVLKAGPHFMKGRKPFVLKKTIIIYNLIMVAFNFCLMLEGWSIVSTYDLTCQTTDYSTSPMALKTRNMVWYVYVSKYIDLLETVFFVLRNKTSQVTFLHVYHHALTPMYALMNIKYQPGGQGVFIGALNTTVHVFMYLYYGIAALGPKYKKFLWWKRHVTELQLVTHNLQVSDGDNGLMLLRDQIVIQIGEELDGMVMIRSGDNRQGICPIKFLQEV